MKALNTNCVCPIHYSRKRFSIIEKHIWNRNLIGAYFDAYDHTTLNAPVPVRSPKLSSVGPDQYLDGWPPGNIRCCRLLFIYLYFFFFLPHITWIVILLIRASLSRFRSFLLEISVECDVKASNTNCVCPIHYIRKRFSIIENHIWNRNLIGAYFDAYDHTTLNAPVPVRSPKLSSVGPDQYLDGWPPGNIRCCRLLFMYLYFYFFKTKIKLGL